MHKGSTDSRHFFEFYVRGWLLCLFVLTLCTGLTIYWYLLRTDYAAGFMKQAFREVKIGDPLDAVLARLNMPLDFVIVSLRDDDSRYSPQYSEDHSALFKWAHEDGVMVILRYSKPRVRDGSYRAYEVWVSKGLVQEKRAYIYWD